MRSITFKLSVAVCLFALALGAPASAASWLFKGKVQGRDDDGIFAGFGRDLTGRPYSLEVDFDASKGGPVLGAPLAFSQGGDDLESPLTVTLTVGGRPLRLYDFGVTTSFFEASEPLDAVHFGQGGSDFAFYYDSYNRDGYANTLR